MPTRKPLRWIGSSREDLRDFPAEIRRMIGYALHFAQMGDKHPSAKPLQGFGGAGVLEIVEAHDGEIYRAVYTVRFAYVALLFKGQLMQVFTDFCLKFWNNHASPPGLQGRKMVCGSLYCLRVVFASDEMKGPLTMAKCGAGRQLEPTFKGSE